jgi:hypothetical protein
MNLFAKVIHKDGDFYGHLTTENSASSYGMPVFVEQISGQAYGPCDVITHPTYPEITALMSECKVALGLAEGGKGFISAEERLAGEDAARKAGFVVA